MEITAETITSFLGAAAVSALVTALFNLYDSNKNTRITNITQERKAWRDKMRELVAEINDAYYEGDWRRLRVLRAELTVRLNPMDPEDEAILEALPTTVDSVYTGNEDSELPLKQFNERMALMLKHDWERAKIEAGGNRTLPAVLIGASLFLVLASVALLVRPAWALTCW